MRRRDLLRAGCLGAVTLALGSASRLAAAATPASSVLSLSIEETFVELIDGEIVLMLLYTFDGASEPTVGPTLRAREGDVLTIVVTNNALGPHGFAIPGAAGASIAAIAPGETRDVTFAAPTSGTYLYLDPIDAPVNRVLGLHGAFVVEPREGATPLGAPTPYGVGGQSAALRALFDALGSAAPRPVAQSSLPGEPADLRRFPGEAWRAGDPERERVWVFNDIDPRFNALLERGERIDPAAFVSDFLPRYFTLNGVSGFDASFDERNVPKGYIGQPLLLRTLNAGMATHAPHIHGNHVFELARAGATGGGVADNIREIDTWTLAPLERVDLLLPFEQPEDLPAAAWPPFEEPFPLFYPMHCHIEMSQTAGGGNYPQGLITDWEILGPLQTS